MAESVWAAGHQPVAFSAATMPQKLFCSQRGLLRPCTQSRRTTRSQPAVCAVLEASRARSFWLETDKQETFTAGLEAGMDVFVFRHANSALPDSWSALARFSAVQINDDGFFTQAGSEGAPVTGFLAECEDAEDVAKMLEKSQTSSPYDVVVMDAIDGWRIIPAENLIAARQQDHFTSKIMVVVDTAEEAKRMLGLLDVGVDGVVLRTSSMDEVRSFGELKQSVSAQNVGAIEGHLSSAVVTSVRNVGTGDRVCVDCCSSMQEDEMMFVGNAAGGLFGVLSEAVQNSYVNAREFRFNAGPVHAYCLVPGGQTRYLSELAAGDEVIVARVADDGKIITRSVVVGRCKIERRPLVLISAVTEDGQQCGHFMQNAETCRLGIIKDSESIPSGVSVSQLQEGDRVFLRTDKSARHMGLAIEEYLIER